ncbi:hypothetical protein ACGGAI_23840 [Streptomyces antibioticus]|uniref:hypothetical protein n=1 Tax=Streptomyces antibioticus TaxID=1890 RepID=UPI0037226A64
MTTATHLQTVINHWADLQQALAVPQADTWPPVMGIARLHDHLQADEQAWAERTLDRANPDQIGATTAPLRITILDTMTRIDRRLVDAADHIAAHIQRPAKTGVVRSAGPGDDIALQLKTLILRDQHDERRWSLTDPRRRTAPFAAAWLLARIEDAPGPFERLRPIHRDAIATAARWAADQIAQALEMTRRAQVLEQPCPHCRGVLRIEGGDGQPPTVKCRGCGRKWTSTDAA